MEIIEERLKRVTVLKSGGHSAPNGHVDVCAASAAYSAAYSAVSAVSAAYSAASAARMKVCESLVQIFNAAIEIK